jgi:proteasome lid subunit RPN8/RPN11
VAHCYDGERDPDSGLLYEACGLLAGPIVGGEPTGLVTAVYPARNADASARSYTVDSRDLIRAMRDAERRGGELVGVWHSHTHTDPYPSETDVRQAPDPGWVYMLVGLADDAPSLRAYRIRDGAITEVPVVMESRP